MVWIRSWVKRRLIQHMLRPNPKSLNFPDKSQLMAHCMLQRNIENSMALRAMYLVEEAAATSEIKLLLNLLFLCVHQLYSDLSPKSFKTNHVWIQHFKDPTGVGEPCDHLTLFFEMKVVMGKRIVDSHKWGLFSLHEIRVKSHERESRLKTKIRRYWKCLCQPHWTLAVP